LNERSRHSLPTTAAVSADGSLSRRPVEITQQFQQRKQEVHLSQKVQAIGIQVKNTITHKSHKGVYHFLNVN